MLLSQIKGMIQLFFLLLPFSVPDVVYKAVKVVDIEKLSKDFENASPLKIMDKALEKYGNDIAIAFSGDEDVALIEYAHLTGRSFRVFSLSLDTGRLNPETYKFYDIIEKHYDIQIEYMFRDAVEPYGYRPWRNGNKHCSWCHYLT